MKKDPKTYKREGTFVRLEQTDLEMMKVLKEKFAVNISALFRNTIRNLYASLCKKKGSDIAIKKDG